MAALCGSGLAGLLRIVVTLDNSAAIVLLSAEVPCFKERSSRDGEWRCGWVGAETLAARKSMLLDARNIGCVMYDGLFCCSPAQRGLDATCR